MATGSRRKSNRTKEKKPTGKSVIQIRRVKLSKEVKNLAWAIVAVGNERGQVGIESKAGDVIGAVPQGRSRWQKHLVDVPLTKSSIPHPTNGGGGAKVMMRPAPGTGVIAGGLCELCWSWQVFA